MGFVRRPDRRPDRSYRCSSPMAASIGTSEGATGRSEWRRVPGRASVCGSSSD